MVGMELSLSQLPGSGSGLLRTALLRAALPEEGGACPERDDAHADGGQDLLRAVQAVAVDVKLVAEGAGGHGDGGVEQEQKPEHRLAVE
jgi:hypothetical protein